MDITTIAGIMLGLTAIVLGQTLEGGHVGSLVQPTAAIIVLGGTIGAVCAGTPLSVLIGAGRLVKKAFMPPKNNAAEIVQQIIGLSVKARKEGLLALESDVAQMPNPFMQKAFSLAVDGLALDGILSTMHADMDKFEAEETACAKVFDQAGAYSPTLGIIGAVLGLIHVMENLSDASKLGGGIAVAFVATVTALAFTIEPLPFTSSVPALTVVVPK